MSQQPDILDRLRDAKPANHELAEDAELWAKITATAPDPRVERQPKRQARARHALRVIPALLAIALAVGIALAGLVLLRHGSTHPSRPASGDAHRGEIVDRNGTVLADTVRVATVRVRPSALPSSQSGRLHVYESLARALGIDGASRRCVVGGQEWLGGAPCSASPEPPASHAALVTVARGVPSARVKRLQAAHLRGVSVAWRWVFTHPGNLAAQAVGLVTPTVSAGGGVGQSGLEATYDRYLRAGDNLSTLLGAGLQRAGEAALKTSLERNHAPGGSFVAMNPTTGEVYAMGSLPTYDGSILSRLSSPSQIRRLRAGSSSLVNRATQSPDRPARCLRHSPPSPRSPVEAGRPRAPLTTQGSTASGEAWPSSVATTRAMP